MSIVCFTYLHVHEGLRAQKRQGQRHNLHYAAPCLCELLQALVDILILA